MSHAKSRPNAGGQVAVAFQESQTGCREYATAIRRLTVREAERLMGMPDDWTLVAYRGGKPMADGPRYKMIGNSMAVPVMAWIFKRIDAVERLIGEDRTST
jgi:DNA (cytosine-5)-methyltransferase 1